MHLTDAKKQRIYETWLLTVGDTVQTARREDVSVGVVSKIVTTELWRRMPQTAREATYTNGKPWRRGDG